MGMIVRGAQVDGVRKDILVVGDRIADVADRIDDTKATRDGDTTVLDAAGMAAIPSLVDGHAHSAMTLLRGLAEDMELDVWLREGVWPVEGRMTDEDVYWGTRLAALEMIHAGTTVCNDMYLHPEAMARAARDSGMRFILSYALIDGMDRKVAKAQREACAAFFNDLPDCGGLSLFCPAAHSVYTTAPESIEFLAQLARERGIPLHTHLSETESEQVRCREETGLSPAAYLDSLGALGPFTVAAHCIWLDEADFDLLAERGVTISYNPVSNMKLASGPAFDFGAARKRGIRVLIGTDGAASNNGLDMFADMKVAALLQKQHYRDPTRFPVAEVLRAASGAGHEFFRTGGGAIVPGAAADFALIDLRKPGMVPCHDLAANLVYAGAGSAVDTTVCAGKILMRGGKIEGEEEVLEEAARRARDLAARR